MKLPDRMQRSSQVHFAENLDVLRRLPGEAVDLIYVDPPFNTGKTQRLDRIDTVSDEDGDRVGFKGRRYRSTPGTSMAYGDRFADYLGFLERRLREFRRVLKRTGPSTSTSTTAKSTTARSCSTRSSAVTAS